MKVLPDYAMRDLKKGEVIDLRENTDEAMEYIKDLLSYLFPILGEEWVKDRQKYYEELVQTTAEKDGFFYKEDIDSTVSRHIPLYTLQAFHKMLDDFLEELKTMKKEGKDD